MELMERVAIALLVIAIVGIIIVGALYPFVKTKEGEQGKPGNQGDPGAPLPTLTAPLSQINATNFPNSQTRVSQYTKTITLNATGNLASISPGSSVVMGILPNIISRPSSFPAAGVAYFDNSNPVPITIDLKGTVTIGPTVAGSVYNLSLVYSVI
jgi:hypothetical protein